MTTDALRLPTLKRSAPSIRPRLYLRSRMSSEPYTTMRNRDVVAFDDPKAVTAVYRWAWHDPAKPRRNWTHLTLEGVTYDVTWL